tara:strand:- start:3068 stop:3232 length:165 start_codon:yes stop_codon:yes gene_type:complete
MASIHRMANENRELKKRLASAMKLLEACHEANLIRMNALKEAGIPDPITGEEEE